MTELIYGLGLVLFIEGALYALFPEMAQRVMVIVAGQHSSRLRVGGLVALIVGFGLIYVSRL